MDGMWPIDIENDMFPFRPVSLSRNREPQVDTRVTASFTMKQLDTVAPLSLFDRLSLRNERPTDHAKRQILRRIELAGKLKYRV